MDRPKLGAQLPAHFDTTSYNMFHVTEKDLTTGNSSMSANASYVKTDSRDEHGFGASKAKIPFHIASIPKPQLEYRIVVNNANQPFYHALLKMSEDGSRFIHPLVEKEKYPFFHFVDKSERKRLKESLFKPVRPSPVENTTFTLVQDKEGLIGLAAKLRIVNEFAVALEHNAYRSFQGLTCLMQISTRTEDFIVDTLKLHAHIGPYLRDIFQDPTKRKVMHGADKGIKSTKNGAKFFGTSVASVWRFRPLTNEMLRHAREDTHYLLHIYDLMKRRLLSSSTDPNCPESLLVEVYKRSYDVCMQLYEKVCMDGNSYLNIYGLHAADLNGQQLAVVSALCQWRDLVARGNDESTGYVLPNKTLIEIEQHRCRNLTYIWTMNNEKVEDTMPSTIGELFCVLKNRHPLIDHHLGAVTNIIQKAKENAKAFEEVAARLKRERLEMH
ncbi:RRP6-like protein 2 [Tanacetum coccineum]